MDASVCRRKRKRWIVKAREEVERRIDSRREMAVAEQASLVDLQVGGLPQQPLYSPKFLNLSLQSNRISKIPHGF